jgi:hypothetical protein
LPLRSASSAVQRHVRTTAAKLPYQSIGRFNTAQATLTGSSLMGAFDGLRSVLKIRQLRRRPRVGFKPRVGAKIVMDDFRIIVQAGLSDALWGWLVEVGFREVTYRQDRRGYRDVPPSLVTELYEAPPQQWRALLTVALEEASKRPRVRLGMRTLRAAA